MQNPIPMPFRTLSVLLLSTLALPAQAAEPVVVTTYCAYEDLPSAKRQTLVVIDGTVVAEEAEDEAPRAENEAWRNFALSFLDARDQGAQTLLAPRERITVAISNPDGSGLTTLFSGCIPVFSEEETTEMRAQDSALDVWLGRDWKSRYEDMAEDLVREGILSLISGAKALPQADEAGAPFAEGALVRSLRRAPAFNLSQGLPRVVVYTDLSAYAFPSGNSEAVRKAAFSDAESTRIKLGDAELHLLSQAEPADSGASDYLPAFFLGSHAALHTLTSASGNLTPIQPPTDVRVYQGSIDFGDIGTYAVRMRLATDRNGTIVNSWIREQRLEGRHVPLGGILNCSGESCEYVGDNQFAQVWKTTTTSRPECGPEMPFGGVRQLDFDLAGDTLRGTVSDDVCFFVGAEDSVSIELTEVPNGQW